MALGKIRATLVELFTRVVKVDNKENNIYLNGENNLYPYEIERVINNSPTATRAVSLFSKFISGKGCTNDVLVNKKKKLYLSDIISMISDDLAPQGGAFVWVGYGINENGDIYRNTLDVLDYASCRISKEDSHDYAGKIYVKDYTAKKKYSIRSENKEKWYYPFNPNSETVSAQMRADARKALDLKNEDDVSIEDMINHYRGQVMYINTTPRYKYALSPFDSVFNDADSEFRFSLHVNKEFRTGFLGKLIVLTQGLDDEKAIEVSSDLGKFLGAENSGSLYHLDVEQTEDLDSILKTIQLNPQFNDKLFTENDKRIRRNILGAANNIPEPLIYAGEGAIFGVGQGIYEDMKLFYNEQTQRERYIVEKALKRLGFETQIIPIIENKTDGDNK